MLNFLKRLFMLGDDKVKGEVVYGKLKDQVHPSYIPFSKNSGDNPVIATEQFSMPRVGANLQTPFNINGITPNNRVWLSMYASGTGHRDAPKTLKAESQYLVVGGREYGVGSYRGIGFGYVASISEIAPVFVGIQEVGQDDHTNADFIVATRASQKNVAPDVKLRVKTDGQIITSDDYTPKSSQALVNKQYLDTIIDELQAQIDELKKK